MHCYPECRQCVDVDQLGVGHSFRFDRDRDDQLFGARREPLDLEEVGVAVELLALVVVLDQDGQRPQGVRLVLQAGDKRSLGGVVDQMFEFNLSEMYNIKQQTFKALLQSCNGNTHLRSEDVFGGQKLDLSTVPVGRLGRLLMAVTLVPAAGDPAKTRLGHFQKEGINIFSD